MTGEICQTLEIELEQDLLIGFSATLGNGQTDRQTHADTHAHAHTHIHAHTHTMDSSPGELSEELVTLEKRKKGWRMNCDVGEATEGLENELRCR